MLEEYADKELVKIIVRWGEWLIEEKNFSKLTYKAYMQDVRDFCKFYCRYNGGEKLNFQAFEDIKLRDFRAWFMEIKRAHNSAKTMARAFSSLKNFIKYLHKYHGLGNLKLLSLKSPKIDSHVPKALTTDEIEASLKNLGEESPRSWVRCRDKALLMLLYAGGLRISEALSIKRKDLGEDLLHVLGKGKKDRNIPWVKIARELIDKYIANMPYSLEAEDYIFKGVRGKPLKASTFRNNLVKFRRSYNLPETLSPHAFRHSFASHLLNEGLDLRSIQELLGHEDLSSTQVYTKIDANYLTSNYSKTHPRAKLKH